LSSASPKQASARSHVLILERKQKDRLAAVYRRLSYARFALKC
jgi:hypothetical protein